MNLDSFLELALLKHFNRLASLQISFGEQAVLRINGLNFLRVKRYIIIQGRNVLIPIFEKIIYVDILEKLNILDVFELDNLVVFCLNNANNFELAEWAEDKLIFVSNHRIYVYFPLCQGVILHVDFELYLA